MKHYTPAHPHSTPSFDLRLTPLGSNPFGPKRSPEHSGMDSEHIAGHEPSRKALEPAEPTMTTSSLGALYWSRQGRYSSTMAGSKTYKFVAVVTPHMREQTRERAGMSVQDFFESNGIVLPEIWADLDVEQCHWVNIGEHYLMYVRRKYNRKRKRWELELISLTPSRHTTTRERTFAKPVKSSSKSSESDSDASSVASGNNTAFPSWFCDSDDEEEE